MCARSAHTAEHRCRRLKPNSTAYTITQVKDFWPGKDWLNSRPIRTSLCKRIALYWQTGGLKNGWWHIIRPLRTSRCTLQKSSKSDRSKIQGVKDSKRHFRQIPYVLNLNAWPIEKICRETTAPKGRATSNGRAVFWLTQCFLVFSPYRRATGQSVVCCNPRENSMCAENWANKLN